MAATKLLRPPLVWPTGSKQLVEDARYKKWTIGMIRAMRNGTYDWSTHKERTV